MCARQRPVAGGIAGSNRAGNGQNGTITGCTNNAGPNGNNYTVYATNGNAGGIAGSNESGAQIVNAGVGNGVKVALPSAMRRVLRPTTSASFRAAVSAAVILPLPGKASVRSRPSTMRGQQSTMLRLMSVPTLLSMARPPMWAALRAKMPVRLAGARSKTLHWRSMALRPGQTASAWRCGGRQYAGRNNQRNKCYTEHYRQSE